ncbi:solute carrier family 13 member 1-like [Scleropages formosus]|uniref:Solute carrier family 13 member 1-like n=1 Tax=Scleropages formosus TaxID=113540 RepID=A0A0P7XKG8_SCLFO|nr:solute carrier family 13 member 1-like [Scleropages formosus]
MGFLRAVWNYRSVIVVTLTPLLLLPLLLILNNKVAECAFTLLLMAVYWLTEALPLSVTALLPALLFPLFGIMTSSQLQSDSLMYLNCLVQVASVYFKDFHLLLIGVVCLATSIEKWNLHKRIALKLVILVGVNPGWLMLGFMASSAFLSMWLSNTSTAAMVMPIVEAVIQQILSAEGRVSMHRRREMVGTCNPGLQLEGESRLPGRSSGGALTVCVGSPGSIRSRVHRMSRGDSINGEMPKAVLCAIPEDLLPHAEVPVPEAQSRYRSRKDHMMCKGLSLSIAYSATIGGLTTLTGTSTNLIFAEQMKLYYPDCSSVNFGNWFLLCFPVTLIVLLLSWVWLHWLFLGSDFKSLLSFRREKSEREKATAKVIQEEYGTLGPLSPQEIITLVIFLLMVLLWFLREPGFMPGWASLFPDYVGYATDATVAVMMGLTLFVIPAYKPSNPKFETLISWKEFQSCMPWEIGILVGGGFVLAEGTKVASNPATITIFLPILTALAEAIEVNPLYILIPTTLCTSFAFLLPASNPPNAIVFTYGHVSVLDMVKAGLGVNIIGVLVVLLAVSTWGIPLYDLNRYPSWAPLHPISNTTSF